MKKLLFILCLLITSCSNYKTETISNSSTTTLKEQIDNENTFDFTLAAENFENYWFENLKDNRPLTDEELTKTLALQDLMRSKFDYVSLEGVLPYFLIDDMTCSEQVRGTLALGYIDEKHPIGLSSEDVYFPELMWGSCSKNGNYVTPVYGWPFFQDDIWWVFINTGEYKEALNDCREIYETCVIAGTGGLNTRVEVVIPDIYLEK